jgi:hypothetical protein
MSVINSQPLIGASGNQGGAYNIERSLRFRSSASAYLNRTPASAGNRKTWTYSAWIKRGALVNGATYNNSTLFSAGAGNPGVKISFDKDTNNDAIQVNFFAGTNAGALTTSVYRDISAWYHIVVAIDTTQATASNRVKIFINNVQVTAFNTSNYPAQNTDYDVNNNVIHNIGRASQNSSEYFDGYIAENHFIDGQALTPSSFGETDTITGVWKPKKYTGTYGTNGFYLKFNTLTSTSTLGNDSSGNSNTWTVNNVSLTTGSTYDSMTDVPTLTSATASNFATLNPLNKALSAGNGFSNGNLTYSQGAETDGQAVATIVPTTGKWYCELVYPTATGYPVIGVHRGGDAGLWYNIGIAYRGNSGDKIIDGTGSAYGAAFGVNDVMGIALNLDAGTVTFYKNNTSQGAITLPSSTTGWSPYLGWSYNLGNGTVGHINFGQRPFAYTPPTGFVALNTFNI